MSGERSVKYSTTKLIDAPMKEVFYWCTDFREDDPEKVTGDPWKIKILEKTPKKVVFDHDHTDKGKLFKQHTIIDLHPPDHWHAESTGNMWDFRGEYVLTPEEKSTRLTVNIEETHKHQDTPRSEQLSKWLSGHWDKILKAFYAERKDLGR